MEETKKEIDLEIAARDFVNGTHLLASLLDNASRGSVRRALIYALRDKIDEPSKLIGEDEQRLAKLIGNMFKLRIVLYGEYLKSKVEEVSSLERKEEVNGEEKV